MKKSKIPHLVINYQYTIGLTIISGSMLIAFKIGFIVNDLISESIWEYSNSLLTDLIGIALIANFFLLPYLSFWFVWSFIVDPCEKVVKYEEEEQRREQKEKYNFFLKSLKKLKGKKIKKDPHDFITFTDFFEFTNDQHKIVVGQYKHSFMDFSWYDLENNELIKSREIDFDKEPNVKTVLKNGPFMGEEKQS